MLKMASYPLTISNSTFTNNRIYGTGGAIRSLKLIIIIINCKFVNNYA